jgi:galactokinase
VSDSDQSRPLLRSWAESHDARLRMALDAERPTFLARAPGRLDVMGGIADYSGSLVLELPTAEATFVAAQASEDGQLYMVSLGDDAAPRVAVVPLAELAALADYDAARAYFLREPSTAWTAYVGGVLVVLNRELGVRFPAGLRLVATSRVPEGKGVSSSAALEVATMQALVGLLGLSLPGLELARLCQMVENHVVGAPCGIMDQITSALGHADHLLALLCQPAEVQQFLRLPDEVAVWGIDSGVRHAVSGSDYTLVRTGAFMGYRIIAHLAGLRPVESAQADVARFDDPHWHGYLANLAPAEFDTRFAAHLPETMRGDEFLRCYGATTDRVTRVDPQRLYAVRRPTAHPVYENARVRRFAELLARPADRATLTQMGALMYASHESYSACGLGSAATDRLVALVREAEPAAGLYGAKITGGGSGGTVAVLGRRDAEPTVAELARRYAQEAGRGGYVFRGSSPGACPFGVQRIKLAEEEWTT